MMSRNDEPDGINRMYVRLPPNAPLEPIETRKRPYRVQGLKIFDRAFDHNPYSESVREAFAREMKLRCREQFPDSELALQEHAMFVVSILDAIKMRLPKVAEDLQDSLEQFFRKKLQSYEVPVDFESWDREKLGSFFADRRLVKEVDAGIRMTYYDEVAGGVISATGNIPYSSVGYRYSPPQNGMTNVLKVINLTSKSVKDALREGYNFSEIAEQLVRQIIGFDLLQYVSRSKILHFTDNTISVQNGIENITIDHALNPTGIGLNQWGKNGFMALLNSLQGDDIGIGFQTEFTIIDLLSWHDERLLEKLFVASFGDSNQPHDESIITSSLKSFIDHVISDPVQNYDLKRLADLSIYSAEDAEIFFDGLRTALSHNAIWGNLLEEIRDSTRSRQIVYTFFEPPSCAQIGGLGIIAD